MKGILKQFLDAHRRFKCAIVTGSNGVALMRKLAAEGDVLARCISQSVTFLLQQHSSSDEVYNCISCDEELPMKEPPFGFVVLYGEIDDTTVDTAACGLCRECVSLPTLALAEIVHKKLEAEAGGEIDVVNSGSPASETIH